MILSAIMIIWMIGAALYGRHLGLMRTITVWGGRVLIWVIAALLSHRFGTFLSDTFFSDLQIKGTTALPSTLTDKALEFFSSGVAFALIMFVGSLTIRTINRSLTFINKVPLIGGLNRLLGMLVALVMVHVEIFLILNIVRIWPNTWLQTQLTSSPMAQYILNKTPVLSESIYTWFISQ